MMRTIQNWIDEAANWVWWQTTGKRIEREMFERARLYTGEIPEPCTEELLLGVDCPAIGDEPERLDSDGF